MSGFISYRVILDVWFMFFCLIYKLLLATCILVFIFYIFKLSRYKTFAKAKLHILFTTTRFEFFIVLIFFFFITTSFLSAYFISIRLFNPFFFTSILIFMARKSSVEMLMLLRTSPKSFFAIILIFLIPAFYIFLLSCLTLKLGVFYYIYYIIYCSLLFFTEFVVLFFLLLFQFYAFTFFFKFLFINLEFWIQNRFFSSIFKVSTALVEFICCCLVYIKYIDKLKIIKEFILICLQLENRFIHLKHFNSLALQLKQCNILLKRVIEENCLNNKNKK